MCKLLRWRTMRVRFFWDPGFLRFNSAGATGSNYLGRMIEFLGGLAVSAFE